MESSLTLLGRQAVKQTAPQTVPTQNGPEPERGAPLRSTAT